MPRSADFDTMNAANKLTLLSTCLGVLPLIYLDGLAAGQVNYVLRVAVAPNGQVHQGMVALNPTPASATMAARLALLG